MWNASKECLMKVSDNLSCIFNSPKALKGEQVFGLPPYAPKNAYMVDEYPASPKTWMHGSAKASSYFVPIANEHGMWLDFNQCFNHTHHVAILISVQGVNPITGMPLIDAPMRLEQYREKCPKHNKDFGAELYCEDCGYKWFAQNYLSTTGTPRGSLWLDGFRADDGSVRQYYFTEEECKGVASQIIGDQRVFAIGIAFYLSKERKKEQEVKTGGYLEICGKPKHDYHFLGYSGQHTNSNQPKLKRCATKSADPMWKVEYSMNSNHLNDSPQITCDVAPHHSPVASDEFNFSERDYDCEASYNPTEEVTAKTYEIAAGAKINQTIYRDPENMDFWQDTPAGMIYINYADEESVKKILEAGKKDRTKKGEGFLADLVAGNV